MVLGGLGTAIRVFVRVSANTADLQKDLKKSQTQLAQFTAQANMANSRMVNFARRSGRSVARLRSGVGRLRGSMQALQMQMLGLMFTAANMAFLFGFILSLTPGFRAGMSAIGSALKVVMSTISDQVTSTLINFAKWLMQLDRETQRNIANFVKWAAVVSVVFALVGAFGQALLFVLRGILFLSTAVQFLVGLIGGPLLAALGVVISGFLTGFALVKKFGRVIAGVAIVILGIIGVILGLPFAVAAFIVALAGAAILWKKKLDQMFAAIHKFLVDVWNGIKKWLGKAVKVIVRFFKTWFRKEKKQAKRITQALKGALNKIVSTIKGAASRVFSAGITLGKNIIDGIVNAIQSGASEIGNAVQNAIPSDLSIGGLGGGGAKKVNDFILTSGGKLIETAPGDTIIGTKTPGNLVGGQTSVEINVNNPELTSEFDVDDMMDEIKRRLERDMRRDKTVF